MEVQFLDFPKIVANPEFCNGQPRIKDTRITVSALLSYLAGGMSIPEILEEYPRLQKNDILQALSFAAVCFQDRYIPLQKAA